MAECSEEASPEEHCQEAHAIAELSADSSSFVAKGVYENGVCPEISLPAVHGEEVHMIAELPGISRSSVDSGEIIVCGERSLGAVHDEDAHVIVELPGKSSSAADRDFVHEDSSAFGCLQIPLPVVHGEEVHETAVLHSNSSATLDSEGVLEPSSPRQEVERRQMNSLRSVFSARSGEAGYSALSLVSTAVKSSVRSLRFVYTRSLSSGKGSSSDLSSPRGDCRGSLKSDMRHLSTVKEEQFVDKLSAEDVGLSFKCRAAANFSKGQKPAEGKSKHLYGLTDYFPVPEARKSRESMSGLERAFDSLNRGSWLKWGEEVQQLDPRIHKVHGSKSLEVSMRYAATSAIFERCQLFLEASGTLSCLYVIGSCAIASSCTHGGSALLVYWHLLNSILYGVVSMASRCFFTRVNWRRGEQLTLPSEVFMSHLKSPGFTCDFLALVGLVGEIVYLCRDRNTPRQVPLPTPAQWMMLLQLFKVWRVALPEDVSEAKDKGFLEGLVWLLFLLLSWAHLVACLFLITANYEEAWGQANWLDNTPYDLDMSHCTMRYVEAFYFAVIGLTSVGYGDLLVTAVEHSINSIFLLMSQLFAARVCADLTWLTSMYNQHKANTHERRRGLMVALDRMGVPKVLVRRVLAYENYAQSMHSDNMEKETFEGLGQNLIEELKLCTYRKLLLQAPFLRMQPPEVISAIVKELRDVVYLPADFIVRTGEHGRELFFVRRGEAKAYVGSTVPIWGQSQEVGVIKAGNYFGELAMLTGLPRGSFVMASSYCICSILPYSAVEHLMEAHPESFTNMVQSMVNMYNLKPNASSWKQLSVKMARKFDLDSDEAAFAWFQSQEDLANGDAEELSARAFDLALQLMNVSQLDRRIFWSELDIDASGGISLYEFKSKFKFTSSRRSSRSSSDGSASTTTACGPSKAGNDGTASTGVSPKACIIKKKRSMSLPSDVLPSMMKQSVVDGLTESLAEQNKKLRLLMHKLLEQQR